MLDLVHICAFTGILTIVGAFFLIFKQKIYLDSQTKEPVSVELPFFGRVQTNAPTFAVIVLGFAAVIYATYLSQTTYITVQTDVETDSPGTITAYAVAKQTTVGNNKHLTILFPNLQDAGYEPHLVLYGGKQIWDQAVEKGEARDGVITLKNVPWGDNGQEQPVKPLADAKPKGFE